MATKIFIEDGVLSFDGNQLATLEEFELADRCVGSVFEALEPDELIELAEGVFNLDSDLGISEQYVEVKLLTQDEIKKYGLQEYCHPDRDLDHQPFWREDGMINITDRFSGYWTFDPANGNVKSNSDSEE